jgi:hypothetical protein
MTRAALAGAMGLGGGGDGGDGPGVLCEEMQFWSQAQAQAEAEVPLEEVPGVQVGSDLLVGAVERGVEGLALGKGQRQTQTCAQAPSGSNGASTDSTGDGFMSRATGIRLCTPAAHEMVQALAREGKQHVVSAGALLFEPLSDGKRLQQVAPSILPPSSLHPPFTLPSPYPLFTPFRVLQVRRVPRPMGASTCGSSTAVDRDETMRIQDKRCDLKEVPAAGADSVPSTTLTHDHSSTLTLHPRLYIGPAAALTGHGRPSSRAERHYARGGACRSYGRRWRCAPEVGMAELCVDW